MGVRLLPKPNVHVRLCGYLPLGDWIKPNISSIRSADKGKLLQARGKVGGRDGRAVPLLVLAECCSLPPFIAFSHTDSPRARVAAPAPTCGLHLQVRGTVIRTGERRMVIRSKAFQCTSRKCSYQFLVPIAIE
jgi:hypothetical protein